MLLLGVREYFQYDPMGDYLNPLLKGRHLVGDRYLVLTPDRLQDGTLVLSSVVLGLEMRLLPDGRFRFFVPERVEYLLTHSEERERGDRERARAERARADRLAAKLLELGIDPDLLD